MLDFLFKGLEAGTTYLTAIFIIEQKYYIIEIFFYANP
jgi:hypothetical protein